MKSDFSGTRELQPELQEQIWRNSLFPMPMHCCCCQLICHQSVMLYMLMHVYLSNLATKASHLELVPTSGFSSMDSSEVSDPCTLGTTFPTPMAGDQFSSSCEASFWKLKSLEVNYSHWCKVRIDVGVKFNLSECFLGHFPVSPGSHWEKQLSRVGVHEQSKGKLLTDYSGRDISF